MKLSFENIFIDATKTVEKIPQTEYLPSGQYPIIDQGQRHIAGYSNHSTGFCADVPAIIFGDHTRVIKYIDKPFFIGADGVKVLKSKSNATDYKYLFYALSSIKIPNTGYNRHFKWLKGSKIPVYNSTLQKRIAKRLDKVQELIAKQKEQIAKLDLLIKSRFLDMFGDPISNPKKWPTRRMGDIFKITSGGTPSTQEDSYWLNGTISWIGSNLCQNIILNKNDGRFITEKGLNNSSAKILPVGTVLIALVGATIGKTALLNFSTTTNQNVAAIWVSKEESYDSLFVFYFIQGLYDLFMRLGSGKFKMANLQFINNLPIFNVPLVLQSQFANFVKSVEQQKEVFSTRLSHLEILYKSLMQEYFG